MDSRTLRVALMMLAIFVAGGFCGWWLGRSGAGEVAPSIPLPPPGRRASTMAQKEAMLDQFTRQMELTDEQHAAISKIMDEWALEMQKVNVNALKTKQSLSEKYSPVIRTNLTASQQKTFDRITEQIDGRRRRVMQNQ